MAVKFHPLPLDVFSAEVRPYIQRLNVELRDLFGLEGTISQPLSVNRSDLSIAQSGKKQVHVTRITPDIAQVVAGMSSSIGTPALIFGTVNTVGTTNTVVAVDSAVAIFDTTAPEGVSTGSAVGTAAFVARRDHVHQTPANC